MSHRFYTSYYFQNDQTEIAQNLLSEKSFYYRFRYEPLLGIDIGERNIDGSFDAVYYIGNNLSAIIDYHKSNFKNFTSFHTLEHLTELAVIVKTYKNNLFHGALIVNCNNKYQEEKVCTYNEKFELVEYREFYLLEKETVNRQKIFFPSIWNLLEEEF